MLQNFVTLYIDTASNTEVTVRLSIGQTVHEVKRVLDKQKAQIVLPIIHELLTDNQLTTADLTGVSVTTGPGSFTGLRVGVSIANTLSTVLRIPVNGLPVGELAEVTYS